MAIDHLRAGAAHGHCDPLAIVGAIRRADVVPAAVLAAEIVAYVGDVDQFFWILVRVF